MLHIEADNWAMTAGLIGLTRLFEDRADIINDNGVRITADDLQEMANMYISFLLREFDAARRNHVRLKNLVKRARKLRDNNDIERYKETLNYIRNTLNDHIKKANKYFPHLPEVKEMEEIIAQLKGVNAFEQLEFVEQAIERYTLLASTRDLNEKLTLNYAKSEILGPLYGQTSILQKTFYAKGTQDHIEQIHKDFVQPAIWELRFHEVRQTASDVGEIVSFLEEHREAYKPFKDWWKEIKKAKRSEDIRDLFDRHILSCSFIPDLPATQTYEEMVFSPLALSRSNAINFHWNFDYKFPTPISAVARLILFMVPFGVAFYNRRIGSAEASETFRFAGLILSHESLTEIKRLNDFYKAKRETTDGDNSFAESILGIFQETKHKADELMKPYYTIIEFHSDYESKKTLLDYYHMPPYAAAYFSKYGNALKNLFQYDLRDEFVRRVLRGVDPKHIVFQYLRLAIKNSGNSTSMANEVYFAIRERRRLLNARKDVRTMAKHDGQVWVVFNKGLELQKTLVSNRPAEEQEGPYRASGRKKLEGIAYRLLNAVKSGNKQSFMDTVFRLYMSANLEIPSIFIHVFTDDGLDFETIGSAFIAGLLGQEFKESSKESNQEEVSAS